MKIIKNFWLPKTPESIISDVDDRIFVSSISGNIFINGSDNGKKFGTDGRTFATINSPIYLNLTDIDNNRMKIISKNGLVNICKLKISELNISTINGSVILENFISDKLTINTERGNVGLKNVIAKEVEITGKSGTCEMHNVLFQNGKIRIESHGSFLFEDIAVSDFLNIFTVCGKIHGINLVTKKGSIISQYGNISLNKATFDEATILTEDGNIDVEINRSCRTKNINSTGNGIVKVKTF